VSKDSNKKRGRCPPAGDVVDFSNQIITSRLCLFFLNHVLWEISSFRSFSSFTRLWILSVHVDLNVSSCLKITFHGIYPFKSREPLVWFLLQSCVAQWSCSALVDGMAEFIYKSNQSLTSVVAVDSTAAVLQCVLSPDDHSSGSSSCSIIP